MPQGGIKTNNNRLNYGKYLWKALERQNWKDVFNPGPSPAET